MDDRDLSLYREAYRYSLKGSGVQQPSDEQLTALVTGELEGEERARVARPMLQSPEAMEKHRILAELHRQAGQQQSAHSSWWQGVGVAATVLLAVAVWVFVPKGLMGPAPDSNHRSDTQLTSSPSGNVSLAAAPTTYRWTVEPGARRYRVEIYDDAAESLWRSSWTDKTRIPGPSSDELTLHSGARYFWVVEIEGAVARERLGPYWFRLE